MSAPTYRFYTDGSVRRVDGQRRWGEGDEPRLPCGHPESRWSRLTEESIMRLHKDRPTAHSGWCVECGALIDRMYGPNGTLYREPETGRFRKWRLMD